jgi:site-specific recombinase XerD
MLDDIFAKFDGAFAESTIKAYRSDLKQFNKWCLASGHAPLEISAAHLADYIGYMSERSASATIRRRIASISSVLKLGGFHDPTGEPEVILAMKRMHRRKGRAQRQAVPLTRNVLGSLLSVCGSDIRGMRDRVMLQVGYESMRRRNEICRFRFEDIEVLPNGRAGLRLNFSKADQYGTGKLIPISPELHQQLQRWGDRIGPSGFLLRSVNKFGDVGEQLHPTSLSSRLQELQSKAGLDLGGRLTGHSFRVGAALDLLDQGEPMERIMLRGGWSAEATVIRYLREWQAI